ncbi:six-hairpin glycosidase [Melioribacter roseus P3M-2]|uniref:Six-hairpin glycosidase n=1 Tax=Melioribacter roseus (strain DSM 23840 / JCM 17771 / VKM B-2668 / P3M-2) TaxID=1191523 RepID=I7A5Z7_MELRP|nr:glycoside hydrolase family 127 protein [Melioribacter roseus]AFN75316.1 six-hairpin glycosidase [Melioribacter roseus P3M-2]
MKVISFALLLTALIFPQDKIKRSGYRISPVDIRSVTINDDFWLPKIKTIQETTIKYAFEKCEEEGRMDNFLIAGGKKKGEYRGKMPFDDTDLYKIIEGASYTLVSSPNKELEDYIDSVIAIIKTGQEEDGYLTTWFTIDPQKPPAWWVKPPSKRWESLESSHELYNSGHLFEAAAAHYYATGKRNFLDIAIKNADLLVQNFGPDKIRKPPGHQIVETGLIKLYQITGKKEYMELAKFFLDIRGDSTTHKLYGEYAQDHIPLVEQKEAVGHAVRALYMYAAMTDIAVLHDDEDYRKAVFTLWDNVVNKKTYITGGLGARHDGEAFGDDYELPNLTAYGETCAAIGSVYWNYRLFEMTGDSKYADVIERTLYNGLISGISLDGKNFFYPNPLESDGEYKFNMGACTRQPWFDCSCCPTNLIRFIPSLPGLIYSVDRDSVYVNLFVGSKADIELGNKNVRIIQKTSYPLDYKVTLNIEPQAATQFTLKIRIPGWSRNIPLPGDLYRYANKQNGKIRLLVNGEEQSLNISSGYAVITKLWEKGDKVDLILPKEVKKVLANEKVKENRNKVAIELGPFVYCAEEADNKNFSNVFIAQNSKIFVKEEKILSENTPVIYIEGNDIKIKMIPYFLWSNRGVGKMKVWLPLK